MDLILLAKIVKMEADIRAAQADLDRVGKMVTLSTAAKWRKAKAVLFSSFTFTFLNDKKTLLYLTGKTSRNLVPTARTDLNRTALFL